MDHTRRYLPIVALSIAILVCPRMSLAQNLSDKPIESATALGAVYLDDDVDLSFEEVFSKPIYRKSYFPVVILGASIIVAGTVSYFTAGAGAPAAATGVSTVASVVGGGGAGSYMAGLSTIGSWFGGNAMLGAAVLNGISLGTVGGGTAWTSLTAIQKVGVMSSVMATALDGTVSFLPKEGQELSFRIRLTVPQGIGSKDVKQFSKDLSNAGGDVQEAALDEDEEALKVALEKQEELIEQSRRMAAELLESPAHPEDLVVLAIIRKNAGDSDQFDKLIAKIQLSKLSNTGYLDYLAAVSLIEQGQLYAAEQLLWKSWQQNPYAIEPSILLVNLLGHRDFEGNEHQILFIADRGIQLLDDDEYETPYGALALNYRLATFYFVAGRYTEAMDYYKRAYDELPWSARFMGSKEMANIINLDQANCLYAQGDIERADKLFLKVVKTAETESEVEYFRSMYGKYASEY